MHQSHFNLFNYALDELLMEKGLFLNLSKSEAFFFFSRKKKKNRRILNVSVPERVIVFDKIKIQRKWRDERLLKMVL